MGSSHTLAPSEGIDLINATGTIKEVMQIILKEFEYQSSLELSSETFDSISHIPVATQIGIHARQVIMQFCLSEFKHLLTNIGPN